jgi:hypothetical protein
MNHVAPLPMNEFVVIRREENGTFQVEYGPKNSPACRYVCSDFRTVDDAIAWVDRLDRSSARIAMSDVTKVADPVGLPPISAI